MQSSDIRESFKQGNKKGHFRIKSCNSLFLNDYIYYIIIGFDCCVLPGNNCSDRTGINTCTAISTKISVNDVDIAFRDCFNRTFREAAAACKTFISNYVSHEGLLVK